MANSNADTPSYPPIIDDDVVELLLFNIDRRVQGYLCNQELIDLLNTPCRIYSIEQTLTDKFSKYKHTSSKILEAIFLQNVTYHDPDGDNFKVIGSRGIREDVDGCNFEFVSAVFSVYQKSVNFIAPPGPTFRINSVTLKELMRYIEEWIEQHKPLIKSFGKR